MIFIKIYSGIVANATKTLKSTVKVSDLISHLNDNDLISRLKEYEEYNEINLWDLGKKAAPQIRVGANLVICCKDNLYIGRIIGIIDDVNGAIGDIVGWARQYGHPWTNVILLKDVVTICQEEKISNFVKEHNVYPFQVLNNFIKLENDYEKQFLEIVKSRLVSSKFKISEESEIYIPEKPEIEIPFQLKNIIDDIRKLKIDSSHQERAHESLIERFFEYLGYERFNEIKFRVGRVDISITMHGKPIIVIEVKKYWNLNVKKDHDVYKQAYHYALINGARFVIISNGDYYAIFDRDNGRTYRDNLKGEFILTSLNNESLQLIDFLKKANMELIK